MIENDSYLSNIIHINAICFKGSAKMVLENGQHAQQVCILDFYLALFLFTRFVCVIV